MMARLLSQPLIWAPNSRFPLMKLEPSLRSTPALFMACDDASFKALVNGFGDWSQAKAFLSGEPIDMEGTSPVCLAASPRSRQASRIAIPGQLETEAREPYDAPLVLGFAAAARIIPEGVGNVASELQ